MRDTILQHRAVLLYLTQLILDCFIFVSRSVWMGLGTRKLSTFMCRSSVFPLAGNQYIRSLIEGGRRGPEIQAILPFLLERLDRGIGFHELEIYRSRIHLCNPCFSPHGHSALSLLLPIRYGSSHGSDATASDHLSPKGQPPRDSGWVEGMGKI